MEFLNVLTIKKLAIRKGCTAERTATIKYKHYVRLTGPNGEEIEGTAASAWACSRRSAGLKPCRMRCRARQGTPSLRSRVAPG